MTVAAARLREDRAPLYVVVPTATQTARTPVLVQLAQAVAAAVEAQRSFDEEHRIAVTLQRSLLPRGCPTWPAWTSRCATSRPARRPRWAATSTSW